MKLIRTRRKFTLAYARNVKGHSFALIEDLVENFFSFYFSSSFLFVFNKMNKCSLHLKISSFCECNSALEYFSKIKVCTYDIFLASP